MCRRRGRPREAGARRKPPRAVPRGELFRRGADRQVWRQAGLLRRSAALGDGPSGGILGSWVVGWRRPRLRHGGSGRGNGGGALLCTGGVLLCIGGAFGILRRLLFGGVLLRHRRLLLGDGFAGGGKRQRRICAAVGGEIGIAVELVRLKQFTVVVGHQFTDRHKLIPLLHQPGDQRPHRLHGAFVGAVEQDNLAVQAGKALHIFHHLVRVPGEPVLGVHRPGDNGAVSGVFYSLVYRSVGGPKQGGRCSRGGEKGLVCRLQILQNGTFAEFAQITMAVGVAAYLAPQFQHPGQGVGALGNAAAYLKEGGHAVVFLQNIQDLVGVHRVGAVVKGEGHHGPRRVDGPDIGLLRLRFRLGFRDLGGRLLLVRLYRAAGGDDRVSFGGILLRQGCRLAHTACQQAGEKAKNEKKRE